MMETDYTFGDRVQDWQGDWWQYTGGDRWVFVGHLGDTRPGFTPLTACTRTLDNVYGPVSSVAS
jgi:hypothetical protein